MKLSLFLNHRCNLRCIYCYGGRKFHRPMAMDMALRAVDFGLERSRVYMQLGFFGGEPLLEMDLIRAAVDHAERGARGRGILLRPTLTTNGTMLDQPRLEALRDHSFHLAVSLDGTREAHDATRPMADGSSSHALVVANVQRALALFPHLDVLAVVDPANVAMMPDSFDFLLDLGLQSVRFSINYEGDWDEGARERFALAYDGVLDRYLAHYRQGRDFRLSLVDSKIITRLKEGYSCKDRCDFGCEEVAVSPTGRLYPCERLVGEDDRDEVTIGTLENGVDEARRDGMIESKNRLKGDCQDCNISHRCMTWCGCVNHAMTGQVDQVSGLLCWFERTIIEGADGVAATLFAERNPLFLRRFYVAPSSRLVMHPRDE